MDLKELLGEELYNQVMEKVGDKHKIAVVSDGNWFPKTKFDAVNEENKNLQESLKARDEQPEDLEKSAGDKEKLKEKIETLQNENQQAKEQFEREAKELKMNTALKLSLNGKVHDPDLVVGLLDREKIKLDENGNITDGLDDQMESLQESKGFLFIPEKDDSSTKLKGFKPFDGQSGANDNDKSLNVGKQLAKMRKENMTASNKGTNYFGGAE